MKIKTEFRTYEGAYLKIGNYVTDDSLAIEAWNRKDGCIARLTVCLSDPFLRENEAYVDTNNYPAVLFNMEELRKYEEE